MIVAYIKGESVFRLRNFNIIGFSYIYFTALRVSVLGPSSSTHIFHRIYSIDNGSVVFGICVLEDGPTTETCSAVK
jgi:hypothetical protein